jgi:iron complex transport system ATP-binding protein
MINPPRSGPSQLVAREVTLGYGEKPVVVGLSTELPDGQTTVIVGANACGKSTLLRGMARLLRPSGGAILLDGQEIATVPSREVARTLGLLPQNPVTPEGVSVVDLVGRGRHPHQGAFRRWSRDDEAAVAQALELTDTLDLADRPVDELSGGQRQRVWLAMVLAQDTPLLLLDEPTTFLDLAHQLDVLDLLDGLVAERGRTVVMVLHDLNQACRYADLLVAMRDGRVHAAGPPGEVVDAAFVQDVFGLEARVVEDPVAGTPMCIPMSRRTRCTA